MSVCRISDIFDVKEWRNLKTGGIGSSKSLEMAPFDTTFYWFAIVYIPLSGTVFDLLDVEKYRDLEIWVRGCSRSLKMVPFDRPYATFYWSDSVSISIWYRF